MMRVPIRIEGPNGVWWVSEVMAKSSHLEGDSGDLSLVSEEPRRVGWTVYSYGGPDAARAEGTKCTYHDFTSKEDALAFARKSAGMSDQSIERMRKAGL